MTVGGCVRCLFANLCCSSGAKGGLASMTRPWAASSSSFFFALSCAQTMNVARQAGHPSSNLSGFQM